MARTTIAALALGALLATVGGAPAVAAPPPTLSYQGVLTNGSGVVVPNGTYGLLFEIFSGPSGGTAVFSQALSVDVIDGLYNVLLSTQTPDQMPGDLELAFDDANQGRYMQVTIQSSTDPGIQQLVPIPLNPRQEIASVPYALNAAVLSLPPIPTREVYFATSELVGTSTISSGSWTILRNSDDTADLEIAVTVPATGCTIEATGTASFDTDGRRVVLSILENGTPVGMPQGADIADRGSLTALSVNQSPSAGPYLYTLGAQRSGPSGSVTQGATVGSVAAGAALKVALQCDG